jgi:fibrillarin-like pre-rRNA processing protein
MKQFKELEGVFSKSGKLFTRSLVRGESASVYGEYIKVEKESCFRFWNPYRSKLCAFLKKGGKEFPFKRDSKVLYLGAATGTTVSHISDIVSSGEVYAVEISPEAMANFLRVYKERLNIIPLYADAFYPSKYSSIVPQVDVVYQDISQRAQAKIFVNNSKIFLKDGCTSIFMLKIRSINTEGNHLGIIRDVEKELMEAGFEIQEKVDLDPFHKDHTAFVLKKVG